MTEQPFTLHQGDCMDTLRGLQDHSVDTVIIDPPYGIDVMNQEWDETKIKSRSDLDGLNWNFPAGMRFDPMSSKNLGEFLGKVSTEILRVVKPGSFFLVFSQPRSAHRVGCAMEDAGFELRDQMIWSHNQGMCKAQGMQNFVKRSKTFPEHQKQETIERLDGLRTPQLTPTFEAIWLGQKPKEGKFWENYLEHNVGLVDFRDGPKSASFAHKKPGKAEKDEGGNHPTQKPLSLMRDLVRTFSPSGGVVLDCFCGSGTTGVAAVLESRRFIGADASERWHSVAKERLKFYTTLAENSEVLKADIDWEDWVEVFSRDQR